MGAAAGYILSFAPLVGKPDKSGPVPNFGDYLDLADSSEAIIPALMTLATSSKLGPYEIVGPLGMGGMGEVYRAHDGALGRDVALKILRAGTWQDADRLRRFRQEAQSTASLSHPNILAIHFVGEHDGAPYIVTELLEGESLRDSQSPKA
jgi:serine/threonine protein kinase